MGEEEVKYYKNFLFADDATTVIRADNEEDLKARAKNNEGWMREILEKMLIRLNELKSKILLLMPRHLPKGIDRGIPTEGVPPTS